MNSARWWWRHERQNDFGYEVEIVDPNAASHLGDLLGVQRIAAVDATPEAAAMVERATAIQHTGWRLHK